MRAAAARERSAREREREASRQPPASSSSSSRCRDRDPRARVTSSSSAPEKRPRWRMASEEEVDENYAGECWRERRKKKSEGERGVQSVNEKETERWMERKRRGTARTAPGPSCPACSAGRALFGHVNGCRVNRGIAAARVTDGDDTPAAPGCGQRLHSAEISKKDPSLLLSENRTRIETSLG